MARFTPDSLFHRPLVVVVLGGGTSAERTISLDSAAAVREALSSAGHEVHAIDPADVDLLQVDWRRFDAAFLALHGEDGEDGRVQAILDLLGVPYTGSGVDASKIAFSKAAAKLRFRRSRVPTPVWKVLHEGDHATTIRAATEAVGYPLVVKPDQQGSSLGVSIVREPEQLSRALATCFQYGPNGIVEAYVEGTEWTVGVFGEEALPLVRIAAGRGFYDYDAKYERGDTRYEFDVDEPAAVLDAIRIAGLAACAAVGTTGIARADIRLDDRGQPWVLEVNTIPGFTKHSLVPKAAARAGIEFGDLCERSLAAALANRTLDDRSENERPAA